MKVLLVLSVLTWAAVQNTAGNLLEVGGGQGYGGVYGGGYSGYYPQYPQVSYQPQIPYQPQIQPIQPVVVPSVQPIQPVVAPNLCQLGAAAQLGGGCACAGYSIQICPFGVESESETGYEEIIPTLTEHKIAEIIDVKLVDEITGEILGEEVEEFDVTGQFYPYNQYGLSPFVGGGSVTGGYYSGGGYNQINGGGFNRFPQVPQPQGQLIGGYGIQNAQGQLGYGGYGVQPAQVQGQIGYGGYGVQTAPVQGNIIGGFGIQPPYMPGASRLVDETTGQLLAEEEEVVGRYGQGSYYPQVPLYNTQTRSIPSYPSAYPSQAYQTGYQSQSYPPSVYPSQTYKAGYPTQSYTNSGLGGYSSYNRAVQQGGLGLGTRSLD